MMVRLRRHWQPALMVFGLLALMGMLAFLTVNVSRVAQQRSVATRWYVHTVIVLMTDAKLDAASQRLALATPGEEPKARAGALKLVDMLAALTRDNPRQQIHMQAAASALSAGPVALPRMKAITRAIEREERRLLVSRQANAKDALRQSTLNRTRLIVLSALLMALLTVAVISMWRAWARADRAMAELKYLASTDSLTGLANRRQFLGAVERELAVTARIGRPTSLAILDIDHFKAVNDRFGHPAGDAVICAVAELARDTMRAIDLVGRVGGEEFALLMPATDSQAAFLAVERLRAEMEAGQIDLPDGTRTSITFSAGLTTSSPGDDVDRLISRADQALYRAKQSGRNRVIADKVAA
jgi:diguanylate cyclase (GGDEF)-like protein